MSAAAGKSVPAETAGCPGRTLRGTILDRSNYWTRWQSQRISRRGVLGGTVALSAGAAGLALVGCGDDDDKGTPGAGGGGGTGAGGGKGVPDGHQAIGSTTEEVRQQFHWSKLKNVPGASAGPKPGGKFVWAGFDPGNWSLTEPGSSIMSSFAGHHYNGLVTFPMSDADDAHKLAPEGDLAKNWEQPDPLTYIFHLNDGIKWQNVAPTNGRAFTAQDVVYGQTLLKDKSSFQAGTYSQVASFTAPDEKTVVFKMKEPAAYLLDNMMVPVHVIAPRELVESDKFKSSAVGTGPFILDSWEPNGTWKAHKNPDYFRKWNGKQLPFLDQIESRNFIGNDAGRIAAFRSGELDTIWNPDFNNFKDLMKEKPDLIGQVTSPPPGAQNYISMHNEKAPWNNPQLRQALSLSIDRSLIDKGIFNGISGPGYSQDWSFFKDAAGKFREWPWDEKELGDFHHLDVAAAKKLYSAAGYSDSNPLKIKYNYSSAPGPGQDLHLLILQQWKANLGVQAEFVGMETIGWIGAHFTREYPDALGSWFSGPAFDPDGYSYEVLHSKAPGNIYGVKDTALDTLLEQQRRELDYTKRAELLQKAMLIDLNQCYRIWTRNQYKLSLRKPNFFNVVDTIHAWGNIGWGAKGDEKVWVG
jgi:peptide/nickel transport system substrate-binding protein